MSPTANVTANTSGSTLWTPVSGSAFVGKLTGLKVDNKHSAPVKVDLLDCFTTDISKLASTGAAQAAEDFFANIGSGKVRFQMTIGAGEAISLGKRDLEDVSFLGKAVARGDITTSDCVVVAQYRKG